MIPLSVQAACLNSARNVAELLDRRRQGSSDHNNIALSQNIYDRLVVFFHSTKSCIPVSKKLPYPMFPVLNILWRIQAMIQSGMILSERHDQLHTLGPTVSLANACIRPCLVKLGPGDNSSAYQREELPICLEHINHAVDQLYELTPSLMTVVKPEAVADNAEELFVIPDLLDAERPMRRLPMHLQDLIDAYSTKITTNYSRNVSGYEQQVIAELVRRLEGCIPRHNTRAPVVDMAEEVSSSFAKTLELYAAEYTGSANFKKLNHIHILSEVPEPSAQDLERAILQCGKRLRFLNAPVEQCNVNFVQICSNPFVIPNLERMFSYLKIDKAMAGRVVPRLTSFDIFKVQTDTYQSIVFSGLSHPTSDTAPQEQEKQEPYPDFASLEQTPKDYEITIRGLSSYTEVQALRLQFSIFGTIIGMWFDEDSADSLTGAEYVPQVPRHRPLLLVETDPSPSSSSGPRPRLRIAKIIYARDGEAEAACINMNGSRFDGKFIRVSMVKREPVQQEVSPVPEGDGVHSRPTY